MARKSRKVADPIIPLLEDDDVTTTDDVPLLETIETSGRGDGDNGTGDTGGAGDRSGGRHIESGTGGGAGDDADSGGDDGEVVIVDDGSFVPPSQRRNRRPSASDDSGESDSGRGSGRSHRGRTRSASGGRGQASEEGTPSAVGDGPRQVAFDSLSSTGKKKLEDQKLSRDFFREGLQMSFSGIGSIVNDPEWALEDPDAEVLAERLHNWLKSLDKKKAAKWEKVVARWQPFLMLVFALVAIVIPRIVHTNNLKKNARDLRKESDNGNGNRAATAAPPASSAVVGDIRTTPDGTVGRTTAVRQASGPPVFHPVRLSRQDVVGFDNEVDA